ncbi:HET-domain-containing protein [Aaosphaeria arxii CBS 175.79]|uniref:HET-domain-containing protein n=1 Tax=Aaosphaeria arxii CBS 175.79 TaxID=1450172 RepID=A0A6A5XBI8_9PLEO|nr:HET-domain-containing protein [Aaosphaeria arxii CBS 175.79]KAF2010216.1 HET-domain-containing protein [Aaosphaeria arxii CBS 175.79]
MFSRTRYNALRGVRSQLRNVSKTTRETSRVTRLPLPQPPPARVRSHCYTVFSNAIHTSTIHCDNPKENLGNTPVDPKSLVCKRCWDSCFNTKKWEDVCLGHVHKQDGVRDKGIHYVASIREIKQSSSEDCVFCSFLWSYLDECDESDKMDVRYQARLYHNEWNPGTTTPELSSSWYFQLDPLDPSSRLGSWALRLSSYTTADDKASAFINARPIRGDVFSDDAKSQMRKWIHECSEHTCCSPQQDVQLPSRVIDLRPKEDPETPRLIQTTTGMQGQYAILVYCWGNDAKNLLTSSNISEYLKGIDISQLPQTIQDAIEVARSISVPYLWVDALCIMQDSAEDKEKEFAMMEDIYRNSLVAIVAASSASASEGFLKNRPTVLMGPMPCNLTDRTSWPIPCRLSESEFGTMHLQCLDCSTDYREDAENINQRAWTLQEQILPKRFLIFSRHTLQWRCSPTLGTKNFGDSIHFEYGADDESSATSLRELSREHRNRFDALERWVKVVYKSTNRKLTLPSDKLPALATLAKTYSPYLGNYYAGMWEYNLLWQMRWTTSKYEAREAKAPSSYRAPSWSWTSLDNIYSCSLDYMDESELDTRTPKCELVEVNTTLKDSERPFGEVTDGHIILKGKLRDGWLIPSPHSYRGPRTVVWFKDDDTSLQSAQAKYNAWASQEEYLEVDKYDGKEWIDGPTPWTCALLDLRGDHAPRIVTCLPLFDDFGLLLEKTENGSYKRIGFFEKSYDVNFWEQEFEDITDTSTVKII